MLIATAGRPLGEVLREQLRATPPRPVLEPALQVIDALEAGRGVDAIVDFIQAVGERR